MPYDKGNVNICQEVQKFFLAQVSGVCALPGRYEGAPAWGRQIKKALRDEGKHITLSLHTTYRQPLMPSEEGCGFMVSLS